MTSMLNSLLAMALSNVKDISKEWFPLYSGGIYKSNIDWFIEIKSKSYPLKE